MIRLTYNIFMILVALFGIVIGLNELFLKKGTASKRNQNITLILLGVGILINKTSNLVEYFE